MKFHSFARVKEGGVDRALEKVDIFIIAEEVFGHYRVESSLMQSFI